MSESVRERLYGRGFAIQFNAVILGLVNERVRIRIGKALGEEVSDAVWEQVNEAGERQRGADDES